LQQGLGHGRTCINEVLAVVEDEKGRPRSEIVGHISKARAARYLLQTKNGGDDLRNEPGIDKGRQVDEPDPVGEPLR
jgi:hypothetical protein